MSGAPRVRANKYLDRVLVHVLAGQPEKHCEDRADELARAFGARQPGSCRYPGRWPGWLRPGKASAG